MKFKLHALTFQTNSNLTYIRYFHNKIHVTFVDYKYIYKICITHGIDEKITQHFICET